MYMCTCTCTCVCVARVKPGSQYDARTTMYRRSAKIDLISMASSMSKQLDLSNHVLVCFDKIYFYRQKCKPCVVLHRIVNQALVTDAVC